MHKAGMSGRYARQIVKEDDVDFEDFEDYIELIAVSQAEVLKSHFVIFFL